jgi:hypothetical protein
VKVLPFTNPVRLTNSLQDISVDMLAISVVALQIKEEIEKLKMTHYTLDHQIPGTLIYIAIIMLNSVLYTFSRLSK